MFPLDLNTTNAIIAARQESVRLMMRSSKRPGAVSSRIGLLLIRLGERLRQDPQSRTVQLPVSQAASAKA